jgi:hypothetical protein
VSSIGRFDEAEFDVLYEKLAFLESALGEEYFVFLQMQTLQLMAKKLAEVYGANVELFKKVFKSIADDEERHRETLGTIKHLIVKSKEKDSVMHPEVKYQNPDAWIRPPTGSA